MDLTPVEEAKIGRYIKRFTDPEKHRERVMQIIEMSSSGVPVSELKKAVPGSYGYVSEVRAWSRREGLW